MNPIELVYSFEKSVARGSIRASGRFVFSEAEPIHALMGPSGIGKSTLARWMVGLTVAQHGHLKFGSQIWCDTKSCSRLSTQERRIGFMAQGDGLFPHLTVAENITYGLRRWDRARRNQRLDELLRLTGLAELAQRYPAFLSGGEKRRLALAQVLAIDPQLLLLDEPFTGLDLASKQELWSDTLSWLKQSATPTILITHDPAEALAFSAVVTEWSF